MIKNIKENFYLLTNTNMSCLLHVNDGKIELIHIGAPINDTDAEAMILKAGPGWGTATKYKDNCLDSISLAWSESGCGDYRETPISGYNDLVFKRAKIANGIVESSVLPQALGDSESLIVLLTSDSIEVELIFTLFETALTRRTILRNVGTSTFAISKCMSSLVDIRGEYEVTTFDGGWISESHEYTIPSTYAKIVNESITGFSSNRHNPGIVISNEEDVFGFNLVWSGNHYTSVQKSHQGLTRIVQGVNPDNFLREIVPGEEFETPEAVITYGKSKTHMTQNMHKFVNEHIVPQYWQYKQRPVLYNSWEGCMFDFNERKLLTLALKAKTLGCELFVLDDGWFGDRNNDNAGLGDYNVNEKKLPNGIKGLSNKIHDMGMQFGLWFEPEAVNPDSNLYRLHPDWAIEGGLSRNELLLDLRKKEVQDYIVENVGSIIDDGKIDYVKWDMNRHSQLIGNDAYEYIIGLYSVLRRIFGPRKNVLLESCASGGNRFDLGMLTFGPQAWASDDTDPVERLDIQQGLYNLYPQSTIGAHISASAHIQTLRATPLTTRANVAFFGVLGVEMELSHLLPVEDFEIKAAISFYKEHRQTFQFGRYTKLTCERNASSWQLDGESETIVGIFHRLVHAAQGYEWLHAKGLENNTLYNVYSRPQNLRVGQFSSMLKHIVPVSLNPNGTIVKTVDHVYKMADGTFEKTCSGAAIMSGIPLNLKFAGTGYDATMRNQGDFGSNVYVIKRK